MLLKPVVGLDGALGLSLPVHHRHDDIVSEMDISFGVDRELFVRTDELLNLRLEVGVLVLICIGKEHIVAHIRFEIHRYCKPGYSCLTADIRAIVG